MKIFILISALLFSFNIQAQDLPPDGKFTINHKNGEIYLTGEVKNREKHGTWEFYYENGQLQAREKYNKGKSTCSFFVGVVSRVSPIAASEWKVLISPARPSSG